MLKIPTLVGEASARGLGVVRFPIADVQPPREVAIGAAASLGVAHRIASRAAAAGLTWASVELLDDADLEERL